MGTLGRIRFALVAQTLQRELPHRLQHREPDAAIRPCHALHQALLDHLLQAVHHRDRVGAYDRGGRLQVEGPAKTPRRRKSACCSGVSRS